MKYSFHCILLALITAFVANNAIAQWLPGMNKFPGVQYNKKQYLFPWAGGMNSCQFLPIDMNNDGRKDILVFDRCGNRKMTFINTGLPGLISYEYEPFYEPYFPDFSHWAILEDYDGDGKEDIFTYSPGFAGIKVYHNVSVTMPAFELVVYPYLTSYQGSGYVNILVTYADYPGIADIDGDGDTDILTFWGLGSFVQYHKNLSVEKYGIPDSLDFIRAENCWGYFAEGLESNSIFLDTCNFSNYEMQNSGFYENTKKEKHTGSTFLIYDPDNDGDQDIAIGDADFSYLIRLENGGTASEAFMTAYDTLFPESKPLNLFSMPAPFKVDANNDGNYDLVFSPFDPSPFVVENIKCNHLYLDKGTGGIPDFRFEKDEFLQEDMMDFGSGAYPVLVDINRDGLTDLLVANYGTWDSSWYPGGILTASYTSSIAYLKNMGTATTPDFNFEDPDFAGLRKLGLTGIFPSFADIDSDGDQDMICGNSDGKLLFFENQGHPPGSLPVYSDPVHFYQNIDVGDYSTPQFIDLDRDNRIDLVIGEKAGTLNYYRNTGTQSEPTYNLVTDSLGKVCVRDPNISYYGYSVPCFFEYEAGKYGLLVGSEQGKLFYFKNIEGNLNGTFDESDSLTYLIDEQEFVIEKSYRTAAAIGDLNGDGWPDLVYGNFSGGMKYYSGSDEPGAQGWSTIENVRVTLSPNPVKQGEPVGVFAGTKELKVHIKISDLSGRVVKQHLSVGKNTNLSTHDLSPGIYICHIQKQESTRSPITCKLIVF